MLAARNESPTIVAEAGETSDFLRYIWLVPTATAAVLVFGAVETGGFALFPVYGNRIGYSEADAALLLTMIGLGNVLLQIPIGMISDRVGDRRYLLLVCALVGLAGTLCMPLLRVQLAPDGGPAVRLGRRASQPSTRRPRASGLAAFRPRTGIGQRRLRPVLRRRHGARARRRSASAWMLFGPNGFGWALALFFAAYIALAALRLVVIGGRR